MNKLTLNERIAEYNRTDGFYRIYDHECDAVNLTVKEANRIGRFIDDLIAEREKIKEFVIETMEREKQNHREAGNTVMGGMAIGSFDTAADVFKLLNGEELG